MNVLQISVVIPTYKRPHLLRRCLAALATQSLPSNHFEVLVISDGPDAETRKTVNELAHSNPSFAPLQLPHRKGPAAARNLGWQSASSDLIAFTDDDTVPDKDWLQQILKAYNGEEAIAYSGCVIVPQSPSPTDYEKNTAGLETADFVTANCCCTKAALQKAGGFDERFSMAWREDSDLHFRLLLNRIPVEKLPQAVVVHPVRKAAWGVSLKEQKKGLFDALLYKKYPQLYRTKIRSSPPWNYYGMAAAVVLALAALLLHQRGSFLVAFIIWFLLLLQFVYKRLQQTSKAFPHVAEMILTSACIPFLSLYWHWYGAWRYNVFYL